MTPVNRVVVVGAGAAGLATVDALRREGHAGETVLLGDEPHAPYDRPPLSKQVLLGTWEPDRVVLRSAEDLQAAGVDFRAGVAATGLDVPARVVALLDGSTLDYDALVVATGAGARRLPFGHDLDGVHVLRGLEDALTLRAVLRPGTRLVVVGSGFLGSEIAAAARGQGAQVAVVDTLALPLQNVLGDQVATMVADLHREHGVELHLGHGVASYRHADGAVTGVVLDDGRELAADVVVVAVGASPAVGWLRSSAVPIAAASPEEGGGGVRCDARGRAADGVWAVGDVAAWWSAALGRFVRVEHRMTATEHARVVARSILGIEQADPVLVPYFWSDQYDLKLQSFGLPSGADQFRVVEGSLAERRFVGLYGHGGRVSAVVGSGMVKALRGWRTAVADASSWQDVPLAPVS